MTKLELNLILALADLRRILEDAARGRTKPAADLRSRLDALLADPEVAPVFEKADLAVELMACFARRDLRPPSRDDVGGALELGLTPTDIRAGVRVEVVDGRWCAVHPSGKRTMGPACG